MKHYSIFQYYTYFLINVVILYLSCSAFREREMGKERRERGRERERERERSRIGRRSAERRADDL